MSVPFKAMGPSWAFCAVAAAAAATAGGGGGGGGALHPWLYSDVPVSIPLQLVDLLMESEGEGEGEGGAALAEVRTTVAGKKEARGMHAKLQVDVGFKGRVPVGKGEDVNVLVVFMLPRGCFADLDELSRLGPAGIFNGSSAIRINLHASQSSYNPELVAEEAPAVILGVEFAGVPSKMTLLPDRPLSFSLPVHLLYHAARPGGGDAQVAIPPPLVFLSRAARRRRHDHGGSRRIPVIDDATAESVPSQEKAFASSSYRLASLPPALGPDGAVAVPAPAAVVLTVPVGDLDALRLVDWVTTLTLACTALALLFVAASRPLAKHT